MGKEASMLRVALTGGAGVGKSSVLRHLEGRGVRVMDADGIAREVVAEGTRGYRRIVARFGEEVRLPGGGLDRGALRERITRDPDAKAALEAIVHPEIIALMEERMDAAEGAGEPLAVVEVPLLFELGMEGMFDQVLLVRLSRELQVERLMARDSVSRERAEALLALQMPEAEKAARGCYEVENGGTLGETLKSVDKWYDSCLKGGILS